MHDAENTGLISHWSALYGATFVYRGFIGGPRLMTTDPVAIAHILANAYEYPKPDFVRDSLASMAAGHEGLLTVEGEQHRRQRRILAPAFGKVQIGCLEPVFWDKATKLRDIWLEQANTQEDMDAKCPRIDVLSWLARATLDVIGEAGFGYDFDALSSHASAHPQNETHNELAAAFGVIFSTARKFRVMTILQVWFPVLRRFRRNSATMVQAHATMERIGLDLIEQKCAQILAEESFSSDTCKQSSSGAGTSRGRDLLRLLIRSNLASATPPSKPTTNPPSGKHHPGMSTREVLCQISTFIAAGHETTASALTWCLYALARAPHAQSKLRAVLRSLEHGGTPEGEDNRQNAAVGGMGGRDSLGTWGDREAREKDLGDKLKGCEYLDWVVREALRLHAPVSSTMRVCARPGGDEIPLSVPIPFPAKCASASSHAVGVDGEQGERWSVRVAEGDIISIPIQAVNRCKSLWGDDAGEFRPERWADPPPAAHTIPGLMSGTLTFLNSNGSVSAGNRACIGWRFALVEIKIFLYTLVMDMEFRLDEDMIIEKRIK
ncbi:hypothetical protein DXG03_004968 [Asterophora parasitica]|uniref:Cytochrome P450 n=1 Tax=Asterophora parasitica TaxID=117018 RepID=A0A9P7GEZ9_9AGAR|nr:hypothetical protein DXG03_004968 [Asterophora parasitica]